MILIYVKSIFLFGLDNKKCYKIYKYIYINIYKSYSMFELFDKFSCPEFKFKLLSKKFVK